MRSRIFSALITHPPGAGIDPPSQNLYKWARATADRFVSRVKRLYPAKRNAGPFRGGE